MKTQTTEEKLLDALIEMVQICRDDTLMYFEVNGKISMNQISLEAVHIETREVWSYNAVNKTEKPRKIAQFIDDFVWNVLQEEVNWNDIILEK